jgi:hypothetical protein
MGHIAMDKDHMITKTKRRPFSGGKGGKKRNYTSIATKKMAKWEGKLLPRLPLFIVKP